MTSRPLIGRVILAPLAVLGLLASSSAEASIPKNPFLKIDPFAALPPLTSRPIAGVLAEAEADPIANDRCVALCELAAAVAADPLGYWVKPGSRAW